jgi:hypothetical protein
MALYTQSEAQSFFDAAKAAYLAALSTKSYQIKDRAKYNQELNQLKTEMDSWAQIVSSYSTTSSKATANVIFS